MSSKKGRESKVASLGSMKIESYRSCLQTEFDLHPHLSVLIGPNGSGKTNILYSILLLKRLMSRRRRVHLAEPIPDVPQATLESTFAVNGKAVKHNASLVIEIDEHNKDDVIASDEKWYSWDILKSRERPKIPLEFIHDYQRIEEGFFVGNLPPSFVRRQFREFKDQYSGEFRAALESIVELVKDIRYYGASQFTDPSRSPVAFEIERKGVRQRLPFANQGHRSLFYDMYISRETKPDKFGEFLSIVGKHGIGLIDDLDFKEQQVSSSVFEVKIGGKIHKKNSANVLVIPQFHIGRNILSPSQLSEGTFKTLALLFRLVTQDSSLLLIEEPEVCVHHGLLTSIVEIIRDYSESTQIVMTTHSETVLDQVKPENVFAVQNVIDSGTKVSAIHASMKKAEMNALRQYLLTEGTLGEYWRSSGFDSDD